MAKLVYSAITSLDGYIADEDGNFDWAAPDEEVFAFVNDLERPVGTYLYGRRMYEVMAFWETAHTFADQRPVMQDFAKIWQVLAATAVLGRRFDWRMLAAMVELEEEAMVAALDLPLDTVVGPFCTFIARCHRGAHTGLGRGEPSSAWPVIQTATSASGCSAGLALRRCCALGVSQPASTGRQGR
jgi:hypothetical protein